MNADFQSLMKKAVRLTRAGDLRAATAAIRTALADQAVGAATPLRERTPAVAPSNDARWVIDVDAREVADDGGMLPDSGEPSTPSVELPEAERFIAGSHADAAAGRRDYKLYMPPGAGARPLPLVVMLHGCTQDPDDFAAGTAMNDAARAQGFFVLYPAQSQQANPQRCWNWFKRNHQRRGRGEPALLAGMTRDVMQRHVIDPRRVYVAGLSAGGAMAAILGDAYPDLYAAVGVHSGLAAGTASDLPSALAAMKAGGGASLDDAASKSVPTIVFHGDADSTVHPSNGEQVIAASVGTAKTVIDRQQLRAGSGRVYTRQVHRTTDDGRAVAEHWLVHGAPHAWSGGSAEGSYTDDSGPDASAEMVRFFLEHPRRGPAE